MRQLTMNDNNGGSMLTTNRVHKRTGEEGFTLIELSIVLVIIGLIVGGVLVGQDLIRAAEIRATISQIEKFNTATNTFRGKFNAIPGDMNYSTRATFGFNTAATVSTAATGCAGANPTPTAGVGDGNGLLDGETGAGGVDQGWGETGCYWVDASSAAAGNLIDGGFALAAMATAPGTTFALLPQYFPQAKLGRGNNIYVYEEGGINYYGMSNISALAATGVITSTGSMAPIQAYNIDKKVDDGYPNSGNVFAWYVSGAATTAAIISSTSHTGAAAGNCFDNTGVTTTAGSPLVTGQGAYVTAINQGQGTGCGLSFKFQ